jgi:hypothetical protein
VYAAQMSQTLRPQQLAINISKCKRHIGLGAKSGDFAQHVRLYILICILEIEVFFIYYRIALRIEVEILFIFSGT